MLHGLPSILHLLHRMQQHPPHTHPPRPPFIPFPSSSHNMARPQHPLLIPPARKLRIIVPRHPIKVMFSPPKHTLSPASRCAIYPVIKCLREDIQRPAAVNVDRVRDIDCLEAMVESSCGRPHLGECGVLVVRVFVVHSCREFL